MTKNFMEQTVEFWTDFARKQMQFQTQSIQEVVQFNQNLVKNWSEFLRVPGTASASTRKSSSGE